MKNLFISVCVISMVFAGSVQAVELSKPSLNSLKQVAPAQKTSDVNFDPSGTIGQINTKIYSIDAKVQTAYDSLFAALLSKEDYNKYKAELKAIQENENLNESEKIAKLAQVATDTSANLSKQEEQAKITERLKTLSDAKKAEYANALICLTNAGFEYASLVEQCKSLIMSISSNPAQAASLAFELRQAKDAATLLKANLKSIKDVTTQVIALNKANGIEVKLPDNKAGKAKKVNF